MTKLNAAIPGQTLGRYELLLPIARGGMAQVWAARLKGTRGFQKLVAVKTILAEAMDGTRAEQMFLEEATLASQIHHPNVVGTLDLGEQDGTLYLVMDFVHGEPVSQVLLHAADHGGVPLAVAVNIVGQAGKGLHAAHEVRDEAGALLGIVHRDVSPHNVLVSFNGTAKLVDFGIAKATARASELTHEGELKGKFAYMAPEQVSGSELDRRADIFGLGVLLYAITTGRHPFRGDSAGATLRNICINPALPPCTFVKNYPPALESVLMKALEKAPEDRWETAYDFVAAVEAAVPECLGSREAEVAAYMQAAFGRRAAERLGEIKLAQQLADRTQGVSPHSSASSLRAVSIDQLALTDTAASRPSLELEIRPDSSTLASAPGLVVPPAKRKMAPALMASAVLAVGALAFGVGRGAVHPSALPAVANPGGRFEELAPPKPGSPLSVPAASAPAAATASALEMQAAPVPTSAAKLTRVARITAFGKHPVPATTAPSAPAAVPQEHATPSEPSAARKPNAWDADNYGGRR